MSCNCNSGDTPEYYITLDGVGADGYSPEINVTQEDTASFRLNLINKNNEQLTPVIPKLSYLNDNFVTNGVFSATLANYSTTAQIAATYLSKADAATTYLKVDGSNANNPITINNLSIQSIGTGTRVGSSGGALTLQGSGVRPAYLQTGSTAKTLALYTDLPTRTSQLTNDSGFLTASDITNKMETNGSNAATTVTFNNLKLSGRLEGTGSGFNIENSNGNMSIIADDYIYLITGTNRKVYYNTNEVATVDQIPTVSNATITLTQGGVTKGSFTLNQSGSATIALDSGGSTIGNQISLVTEDSTRSLVIGVDNTTKKVIANYNLISEGTPFLTLPIKLISSATAPILMSESSANGLYNIDLDYNANSLTLDSNNKLAVDSDYIEAHKAYLADGDTLIDPQGLQNVTYYKYSSFDESKFTVVGSPTITDDGIASGFSTSNYLLTSIAETYDITSHTYTFGAKYTYATGGDGVIARFGRFWLVFDSGSSIIRLQGQDANNAPKNFTNVSISAPRNGDEYYIMGSFGNSGNVRSLSVSVNGGTPITGTDTANTPSTSTQVSTNIWIGINNNAIPLTAGSVDLKRVWLRTDGFLTFTGNKTGVDTYTIGSDTITIPYKVSKTGSKIVDSAYRIEVTSVYEDQGYAPYYTLDETNGNFTLPMGEIYGYITRLEGIVKDLQTRLTALESNIDAGGAGVVQQGLLGMSPLSLGRPQLLGGFNPEDEMDTMDIEPVEDDIQREELEPQETEEEGGEDE